MIKKSLLFFLALILIVLFVYWFRFRKSDSVDKTSARLDQIISAERINTDVESLASKPHRAGSEQNRRVGDAIIARLQQLGLEVSTAEYEVTLYEPVENQLTMTAPENLKFSVREKVLPEDPYSGIADAEVAFFAYSPDADLETEVIYGNFGAREDYAKLKALGINPAGKIALVRAQGICRSMKATIAAEEGVAGLLLFPEIRDQGMTRPAFPSGAFLNPWTAQRGSLLKYFESPGSPENTLPSVPSLPISDAVAAQILKRLSGPVAPAEWQGLTAPQPYTTGPGPARVHLSVKGNTARKTIRNIFGTLKGSNLLEPKILVASHYDAWVYGACDPISGVASILETAAALAQLKNEGWAPRRSVVFTFWDAEEYGLLGSSLWVQQNLKRVQKEIAAQVYVDSIRGKNFTAYITPGLEPALEEALKHARDPEQDRAYSEIHGTFQLPGYSDDTAPFTGFVGTPTARLGFGTYYNMYHSLYDDPMWMSKFGDPGYRYTAGIVKILSLYVQSLASEPLLAFQFSQISRVVTEEMANRNFRDAVLEEELRNYDQAANRLQEVVKHASALSPEKCAQINGLLLKAMQAFASSADAPFAKRNVLVASSDTEGCVGELAPALSSGKADEIERVRASFRLSRNLLEEAAHIAVP